MGVHPKHNPEVFISEVRLVGLRSALEQHDDFVANLWETFNRLRNALRRSEGEASETIRRCLDDELPLPDSYYWCFDYRGFSITRWGRAGDGRAVPVSCFWRRDRGAPWDSYEES